jgi:hypothetical protein
MYNEGCVHNIPLIEINKRHIQHQAMQSHRTCRRGRLAGGPHMKKSLHAVGGDQETLHLMNAIAIPHPAHTGLAASALALAHAQLPTEACPPPQTLHRFLHAMPTHLG